MKTTSGTSVLPFSGPAPSSNMVSTAPQPDSSASFHEVLHQQGGDSSSANDSKNTATTSTDTVSTTATPATAGANASPVVSSATTVATAKAPKTTMSVVSDISAMLVQAAAVATSAQKAAPATPTPATGKDTSADTTSDKDQPQLPTGPDLATLIAQALMVASNTTPTAVATTTATTTSTKTDDSGKGATVENASPTATTGADLSTLIAQASILASSTSSQSASNTSASATIKVSASVGKDLPMMGPVKVATASPTKEKKSASTSDEGTFLQPGTEASSTASSLMGMVGAIQGQGGQSTGGQQLATGQDAKKSPLELLTATASGTAGTANVEKKTAMNADQNIPQALSGLGANMVAHANTSDMQIKLSSNNDFNDALKQVMHVAQLTQTNESRTPMRVAIEIQTPPGAVVNVYVSKQNDQWRAQLSTNDPVALTWVQDKMTSLRQSNDLGVQVRWLPPQMEAASTSSGNDANLSWDRGGQGQSNYQQPDDRQQNQRQETADDLPEFATFGSNFMNKLTTAGSAA